MTEPQLTPAGEPAGHGINEREVSTQKEAGRSEISKFFPKPDSNDHVAASHLLRKRYRVFGFPVAPSTEPPSSKHVELSVAMDMLDHLLAMPANDIHLYHEQYMGE